MGVQRVGCGTVPTAGSARLHKEKHLSGEGWVCWILGRAGSTGRGPGGPVQHVGGCQGDRAEPALPSGIFIQNLLTPSSCCTDVFVHWERGGKTSAVDASKVHNQTKTIAGQGMLSKMEIIACDKSCILVSEAERCCCSFLFFVVSSGTILV